MKRPSQPDGLMQVLLDGTAELGDRDDAAMDLSKFDDDRVEAALALIASDPHVNPTLADTCGESIAEIWCRKGRIDAELLGRLTSVSRFVAIATIRALCPDLAADAEAVRKS